jgi:lipoprotein-anchoring transpeptidase ErfK/SrfK
MKKALGKLAGVAAVALVAAAGAAAWLVLPDDDEGPGAAAAARPAPAPAHPGAGREERHAFPTLGLSPRGYPLIWPREGEEVPIRAEPGGKVLSHVGWKTEFGDRTVLSVFEHRGRWAGVPTASLGNGELGWVKLDARRLGSGWTPYSAVIDLSARHAELLKGDRVLRSFAVTVGAPGTDTPTGRFATTDEFVDTLDRAAYGCCAIALTARQPKIPSGWLGGDRVAIHGTMGPLGEALSHGCVRAADPDVQALQKALPRGAPVVIRN